LRWRIDEDIRYGTHMCYGAAVGLLFLGGGAITLGRTPSDVAVLLMSLFPVWPSSTSDQQYHLQPLRHLYVLATRQRAIDAIDVDTWQPVFIPLEVLCSKDAFYYEFLLIITFHIIPFLFHR